MAREDGHRSACMLSNDSSPACAGNVSHRANVFRKASRASRKRVALMRMHLTWPSRADYAVLAIKVAPRPHCFMKFPFDRASVGWTI